MQSSSGGAADSTGVTGEHAAAGQGAAITPASVRPAGLAAHAPEALVGRSLGSYRIIGLLGRGGMADIFTARHLTSRGRVAIKRLIPALLEEPEYVELFLHEAELAARLSHPNLVRCIDFECVDGVPFMVLEYVDGAPLDLLLRWMSGRAAFPPPLALAIVRALLRGLGFAHAARDSHGLPLRVVHQDVSPDNVLIARTGEIKLTDFGIAKSTLLEPHVTHTKDLRGKMGYMPPEQILGLETDPRSDLFAVGVVLAELLRGNRLFSASDALPLLIKTYQGESAWLGDLASAVPAEVAQVLSTALEREPARRFRSAGAFERAVVAAAGALGPPADGGDVVAWLAQRGLMPRASGIRLALGRGAKADDFTSKLDVARRDAVSLRSGRSSEPVPSASSSSPFATGERFRVETGSGAGEVCTLAELLSRVATGRLGRSALVSAEHGPPQRICELAPLAFLTRLPAYCFDEPTRRPEWRATLGRAELPSLLFALARARVRGMLSARTGDRIKRIYFEGGVPVFVASSEPGELLGRQVIETGWLTEQDVDANVELAARQGRHLADALVARKLAPPGAMLRLLVTQLVDRVLELAAWSEGELEYHHALRPGVAVPGPLGPPSKIACQMVRTRYTNEEIERLVEPVLEAPLAAASHRWPAGSLALSDVETVLVHCAASASRAASALQALEEKDIPLPHARRALFLTLSAGLLVSPAWPRRARRG